MVDSVDISEYEHMDAVEVLRGTKSRVLLGIERKAKSENSGERSLGYEMITLNRNSRGRIGLVLGTENGEIIVEDTVPEEPAALYVIPNYVFIVQSRAPSQAVNIDMFGRLFLQFLAVKIVMMVFFLITFKMTINYNTGIKGAW